MADPTKKNRGKKGNKRMIRGRKKRQCESYRRANRRERNKAIRLRRHLRSNPTDGVAATAFAEVRFYLPK